MLYKLDNNSVVYQRLELISSGQRWARSLDHTQPSCREHHVCKEHELVVVSGRRHADFPRIEGRVRCFNRSHELAEKEQGVLEYL
jgi:hypothetical protein